jgi:CHAT domain-containing protein/tetratricopeptide (TPR) repeat protein
MATRSAKRAALAWALAAVAALLGLVFCRRVERVPPVDRVDREWPAGGLRPGGAAVAAALKPGEVHRYRLPLHKGQLLRLVVDQQGIDVAVAFEDPAGTPVLKADRLIEDRGPELVLAVTAADGVHTLIVSGLAGSHAGRYAAHVEALHPASAADRRAAEAYRLFTGAKDVEPKDGLAAMQLRMRALATWRELGDVALQAEALESIALQHFGHGEYRPAADLYRQAADAFRRAGDHRWEAIARIALGSCLLPLGEAQEAADQYALALPIVRQAGDTLNEAKALNGLGQAARSQGDLQTALDRYGEALVKWPEGDRSFRPYTLHNLGVLYARYLGDPGQGVPLLLKAKAAWLPDRSSEAWKARTLSQLGRLADEQVRLDEAHRYFEEALALRRENDVCQGAVIVAGLARVEEKQGKQPAADASLAKALQIVGSQPCPTSEPAVQLLAAEFAAGRKDPGTARKRYLRAEALFAAQGDRLGRAASLAGLARSERSLGDRQQALAASRRGLAILEGVRPTVLSDDLRASFFSGARPAFDFQVDLLLEMNAREKAWITAERARARVLGDLLAEAGAGLQRNVPTDLAEREGAVQRQLNALETARLAMTDTASEDKVRSLRQRIDASVRELEDLRGELRRSPRNASLLRPEPVSLAAAQRELLDGDTVLLEYQLGETASHLWVVTRRSLTAARLPPRREIEPLAREVANRLKSVERHGERSPKLCELSRMLLAPAAPFLGRRRLVVVADGALEVLSFAALPDPTDPQACPAARPLVDSHEVAYLPSVSTLLTQRHLRAGRRPAPGWLAVEADPVYDSSDERLRGRTVQGGTGSRKTYMRLPGSADEAVAITAGLPAGKRRIDLGFAASRQTVLGGALQGFRILHFATHGTLNSEHPMLSALALSEFDAGGEKVDGSLPAHEIYDLDLPAELVVLSACDTALGNEVAGEGLVSGLPRAFLYAGAARVLVSLWAVEDDSTRDLMTRFYKGLFSEGLAPARALQEAQRAMAREGLPPKNWAAFVLLGDWRPLPPFRD